MTERQSIAAIVRHANPSRINPAFHAWRVSNENYLRVDEFTEHREQIAAALGLDCSTIDETLFSNYGYEPQASLLKEALEHRKKYSRPSDDSLATVGLVHPFFRKLTSSTELSATRSLEEKGYLRNIKRIMELGRNQKINLFLFDTLNGYAAGTSRFMEKGVFTGFVPTRYRSGNYLLQNDLEQFADKRVYLGGGYNGHCLGDVISTFQKFVGDENTFAISDACCNSVGLNIDRVDEIWPPYFICVGSGELPSDRVLTLDTFVASYVS